ncbi:MAG: Membrane protein, putative, partial [uncultured Solirubrobacteraceae bacterium]
RRADPAAGAAGAAAGGERGAGAGDQQALERLRNGGGGRHLRAPGQAGPAHRAADGRRGPGGLGRGRGVRLPHPPVGVPAARAGPACPGRRLHRAPAGPRRRAGAPLQRAAPPGRRARRRGRHRVLRRHLRPRDRVLPGLRARGAHGVLVRAGLGEGPHRQPGDEHRRPRRVHPPGRADLRAGPGDGRLQRPRRPARRGHRDLARQRLRPGRLPRRGVDPGRAAGGRRRARGV